MAEPQSSPPTATSEIRNQKSETPPPLRVLLVEDNEDHAALIQTHLRRAPGTTVQVHHVTRLGDGIAHAQTGAADAVLLDMMLPDSSGIETVGRFHAQAPLVPIVVLTSAEDERYALEALHQGAEDYIFKGAADAQNLYRSLRYAIERYGRRRAEIALDSARQELRIAQTIQEGLYPRSAPPLPGFEVAGSSRPAESVGGDYFDYFPMFGGRTGIAVGDVSGHGLGPAILMAETRATLRSLCLTCPDPGETLTQANRVISDGMAEGRFVTLLLVALDPRKRVIQWAGAGHPDGLIFAPDGRIAARLPSPGCPLGVLPEESYTTAGTTTLLPGQLLLLYSDGVFEASPPGPMIPFGENRMVELVARELKKPASQILESLHDAVTRYTLPGKPLDDITAVVVKSLA